MTLGMRAIFVDFLRLFSFYRLKTVHNIFSQYFSLLFLLSHHKLKTIPNFHCKRNFCKWFSLFLQYWWLPEGNKFYEKLSTHPLESWDVFDWWFLDWFHCPSIFGFGWLTQRESFSTLQIRLFYKEICSITVKFRVLF